MGFAISWLCVQGNEPSAVRTALSLEHVGPADEPFEAQYTGFDLGRRGYLIAINDTVDPLVEDASLRSLSSRWKVIACQVEEHTMHCISQCWSNGRKDWHVEHNAQLDPMHLEANGNLPVQFGAIKDKAFGWQKATKDHEVDYIFEIPSLVAWRLTGFKHDRGFVLGRLRLIEELAASVSVQAGPQHRKAGAWWKFW
jgi:hypothetical protein